MIRKIACFFLLLISALVMLTAMNQSFINRIKQDRYMDHLNPISNAPRTLFQRVFVRSDRWGYGDLYGLCYLPQYRFKLAPFKSYNRISNLKPSGRILYIIGDSFLADKVLIGAFKNFDNVIFLDRRFKFGPITLDSTKQNYLIMEFAERNLNGYSLPKTYETTWSSQDILAKHNYNSQYIMPQTDPVPPSLLNRLGNIIFNKDLSRNLELLLFDDTLFTPLKSLKASLNYNLFGRLPKEVAVSTDKKRLLLNITVDTADIHSAFRPKSDGEIDKIVQELNKSAAYYRFIGFKKVFLSVIPNPVSLYDSGRMPYNNLLKRTEVHTQLPVISVYDAFKKDNRNLYYLSDAHWNPLGFDLWINQTNKVLKSIAN